jgi:hypothetical protein
LNESLFHTHRFHFREYAVQVTLTGPDDLGYWFLTDSDGNSFPFIECHEDHPTAAAMLGWVLPEDLEDEEEIIQNALDWLLDHTGDDFKAPAHVAVYFNELYEE